MKKGTIFIVLGIVGFVVSLWTPFIIWHNFAMPDIYFLPLSITFVMTAVVSMFIFAFGLIELDLY